MENQRTNLLYEIFERELYTQTFEAEEVEAFAKKVAKAYLMELMALGYILLNRYHKELEEEFTTEVLVMTRKKTYGFASLTEFRKQI